VTVRPTAAGLALAGLIAVMMPAAARATPDELVRIGVQAPALVAAHGVFPINFTVNADAGALDVRQAPVRLRVRFAPGCGAFFDATPGPILLDRVLDPQPSPGRAYAISVGTRDALMTPGSYTVCAYLEQFGDDRVFAEDTDSQITVTAAAVALSRCRVAQARVARVKRSLSAARSPRRRTALRRRLIRLRHAAAVACRHRGTGRTHRHHHRHRAPR